MDTLKVSNKVGTRGKEKDARSDGQRVGREIKDRNKEGGDKRPRKTMLKGEMKTDEPSKNNNVQRLRQEGGKKETCQRQWAKNEFCG